MAREQYVDVICIANGVKRSMNVNSFKLNQKKFRLADGQSLESAQDVKKKDVEPAVSRTASTAQTVVIPDMKVETGTFPEQELPSEFAPPTEDTIQAPDLSPEALLETLKVQYEEKYGKAPDKRWNVSRLTKEING